MHADERHTRMTPRSDEPTGDAIYQRLLREFADRGVIDGLEHDAPHDAPVETVSESGAEAEDSNDERDALIKLGVNVAWVVVNGVGIAVGIPIAF